MRSEETPLDAAIRGLARGARRLDRVIEVWRPAAWLELDRRIRSAIGQGEIERPAHPWTSTSRLPAALRAALRAPAPTEAGLALALCDPSGLIRQAALPTPPAAPPSSRWWRSGQRTGPHRCARRPTPSSPPPCPARTRARSPSPPR
ncbi:hypothetical protein AB6O49_05665 [Streptomyces sp. SBR177]